MIFATVPLRVSLCGDGRDGCDPNARPAGAGVCEFLAAGVGRGAPGGAGCGDQSAAGAGEVRAGRPAAPAPADIPGLSRAEPDLRGHLLAELRVGRAWRAGVWAGG